MTSASIDNATWAPLDTEIWKRTPKAPGVYAIRVSGEIYIGKAMDLRKRMYSHCYQLPGGGYQRGAYGIAPLLYRAWCKHKAGEVAVLFLADPLSLGDAAWDSERKLSNMLLEVEIETIRSFGTLNIHHTKKKAIGRKQKDRCRECGEKFTRTSPAQKFCDEHRPIKAQPKAEEKACLSCGVMYPSTRAWSKFCGDKCREKWWKENRRNQGDVNAKV